MKFSSDFLIPEWASMWLWSNYGDVMMSTMAYQISSLTIVYSTVYSGTDQRNHQSSALLAFVLGIHRWPMNSPQKGPVTRKMFPYDDVIMSRNVRIIYIAIDETFGTTLVIDMIHNIITFFHIIIKKHFKYINLERLWGVFGILKNFHQTELVI